MSLSEALIPALPFHFDQYSRGKDRNFATGEAMDTSVDHAAGYYNAGTGMTYTQSV